MSSNRFAVCAALAVGLFAVSPRARAQSAATEGEEPVELALPEPLRASLAASEAPEADLEPLARRVGAFGPPVLPYLVALLAGTTEAGTLAPRARALVLRASEHVGHDAVVALLRPAAGRASWSLAAAERGAALALLERNARREDLALALDLAGGTSDAPADKLLGDALFRVAASVLRADPVALGVLARLAVTARAPAAVYLVRAIGTCAEELGPDRDPLGVLSTVLGYDPGLDRCVLGEIGRVTLALPGTAPADLCARISSYLDDADAELVREAVQALGRLDAHDALPTLVGMLDDDRATVREATLWALRAMTGLRLGADTARWRAWLDEETAWWDGEAAALLSALRTRDEARVRHALHELRKHRVHRDRIAPRDRRAALERVPVAPQRSGALPGGARRACWGTVPPRGRRIERGRAAARERDRRADRPRRSSPRGGGRGRRRRAALVGGRGGALRRGPRRPQPRGPLRAGSLPRPCLNGAGERGTIRRSRRRAPRSRRGPREARLPSRPLVARPRRRMPDTGRR